MEVLHSKTKTIKDTIYIFDIIVNNGEVLVGTTFAERQKILMDLFVKADTPSTYSHYVLAPQTWLAKLVTGNFSSVMAAVNQRAEGAPGNVEDEGLVIKNPNAKLAPMEKEKNNTGWQVKTRIQTKNYSF